MTSTLSVCVCVWVGGGVGGGVKAKMRCYRTKGVGG